MQRPIPPDTPRLRSLDGCLTLRVLGEPALHAFDVDGAERRVMGVGKPLALLSYLAIVPQHEASREFLADLLWGGSSVADPAHSLRNALVSIKNSVGRELIEATASRCRLTRAIPSDLEALTSALQERRLQHVTDLYGGEFFAGFAAPGCQQFELWCDSVRLRVRTDVANAADVRVRQLLDNGHPREAAHVARRMIEIDPMDQRRRRALLEALIAAGDELGALTEVTVLEEWLRAEELEAEPATRALILQASKAGTGGRRTNGESRSRITPDLVGREGEFAEIIVAWERARRIGPAFVAVTAGTGVGKSRLLADAANRLSAERSRVVAVAALPGERDLPFAFVAALVGALAPLADADAVSPAAARVLAALDPSLAERYGVSPEASTPDQLLRRAFALRELLFAASERKPLAVFLDDLHWADEPSANAILSALTRLPEARLLVVTASRPGGRHPVPPERSATVTLRPLTAEQLGQLVASIRPWPADAWTADVTHGLQLASRGIPLFAILALRGAEDLGLLVAGESEWECPSPDALLRHLTQDSVLSRVLRDLAPCAARMLGLLALAGREVPFHLFGEPHESPDAPGGRDAFSELERRALATRHGDRCLVAHDLVAEAVLEAMSDADRRRWSRELAEAMLATHDLRWLQRGTRLLSGAASPSEIARALGPALATMPATRNESVRVLLGSWLGESPQHQQLVRDVARHLPLTLRARPFARRLSLATGIMIIVGTAAAAVVARTPPPPDAVMRVVVAGSGDTRRVFLAELRPDDWSATKPLLGRVEPSDMDTAQTLGSLDGSVVSLRRRARVVEQVMADGGGSELINVDEGGRITRLTNAAGDDVPESWSPDGRLVVFASSRWSAERHHRLAVLDTKSGTVRKLTLGDGLEGNAVWSPDGTRIAFTRRFLDERLPQVCIVDVDGANEWCLPTRDRNLPRLLGWSDPLHVLVNQDEGNRSSVWALAPDSGWSGRQLLSAAWAPSLSPNSRWIAWRSEARLTGALLVAPLGDLSRRRRLHFDNGSVAKMYVSWTARGDPAAYVSGLAFAPRMDTVVVGVPHRPSVELQWSDGARTVVERLTWRVDGRDVARIDSLGTIVARRPGSFVVRASAGGWRSVARTFVAVPRRTAPKLDERWSGGTNNWKLFGDPKPRVVEDAALGMALSNEGDGTYFSGAYLKAPIHARHGLAMEAEVRTPLTRLQWQSLQLDLRVLSDPAPLERWDHRTGYMPGVTATPGLASCGLFFPVGEGVEGRRQLGLTAPDWLRRAFDPSPLARGAVWRIRIQILPDGRCGVAVNGQPISLSTGRIDLEAPLLLVSQGNSWRSRMLLGRVTILEGVPDGVDWSLSSTASPPATLSSPMSAVARPARTTPRSPR